MQIADTCMVGWTGVFFVELQLFEDSCITGKSYLHKYLLPTRFQQNFTGVTRNEILGPIATISKSLLPGT